MPRKNVIFPINVLSSGDMSQATLTSNSTNIQFLDNIGIQFNFTGTPTGAFFVDVSNDNVNWATLVLNPAPVASGAAGTQFVDIIEMSSVWIRSRYTKTSGTGTLNVILAAKEI